MSDRSNVLIHASYVVEYRLRARDIPSTRHVGEENRQRRLHKAWDPINNSWWSTETFHVTLMLARAIGN